MANKYIQDKANIKKP